MKPRIVKVDDTWTPLRALVVSRLTGKPYDGLAGVAATFRLYDTDRSRKLLSDVPADVEMESAKLIAVSFTFTAAHWAAIKVLKASRLSVSGYSAEWRLVTSDGGIYFVPRSDSMERVLLTFQAT